MSRSAWGLGTPRGAEWRDDALCGRHHNPDLWFSEADNLQRQARHLCRRHCPVFEQCLRESKRHPPNGGMMAGVAYTTHNPPRPQADQPRPMGCGPFCDQYRQVDRSGVAQLPAAGRR